VLSYSPSSFDRLLAAFERGGIPILELDELLCPRTPCGVALTFDDGIRSVFSQALPILRSHSANAHLFLTTGFVGMREPSTNQARTAPPFEMLNWSEIERLQASGMRIEAHTKSHPDLRGLSDDALRTEFEGADETIAMRLGSRPRYFAYPYGKSDARVRAVARSRYAGSFTTDLRMLRAEEDKAELPRLDAYYLRHELIFANLRAFNTRAYLAFRRALRRIRS
jgi:peptidoglycan/xylan/chitin deacetylase (PgdA/CDA1 family)